MFQNRFFRPARFAAFALAALALCGSAQGAGPRALLDRFAEGLQGLSGQFEQRVFDAEGRLDEESRGQVALSAPRLLRWEYQAPHPQLIVADGNRIWIYDPDLEQVQVRPQADEEQQNPLAALTDPDELERQFQLSDGGQAGGLEWLELQPRGENAPFSQARLGFAGPQLQRMEMRDGLGQRTEVVFSGWQRNPAFAADTFRFVPPEGVDVIGAEDEAAHAFPLGD